MDVMNEQPSLDDLMPKVQFQFPDGSLLTMGTRSDPDSFAFGVQIIYESGSWPEPEMNILLPPHSIDEMIPVLEEMANQARYLMGQKLVDYPPRPEKKPARKRTARKAGKAAGESSEPAPEANSAAPRRGRAQRKQPD